jgi:heme/copper-type cytochrome/quinol oxidase subunit 2
VEAKRIYAMQVACVGAHYAAAVRSSSIDKGLIVSAPSLWQGFFGRERKRQEDNAMNTQPASDSVPWSQWVGAAVMMSGILAGLEFMVYRSLAPLERGEQQNAAVWAPIAVVYEICGFSAALSVIPILWLILMGVVVWQTWERMKAGKTTDMQSGPSRAPPNV